MCILFVRLRYALVRKCQFLYHNRNTIVLYVCDYGYDMFIVYPEDCLTIFVFYITGRDLAMYSANVDTMLRIAAGWCSF